MSKKLIVYFSYTGNTKKIVDKILEKIDADVIRLEPEINYSEDYNLVTNQGKEEVESGYKPKLKNMNMDLSKYDTIIIGTPVWWYTYTPVINTFLSENDLSNKIIIPFATNAGWLGHTLKDFEKNCPNSKVKNGIGIKFSGNNLKTENDILDEWINKIGKEE